MVILLRSLTGLLILTMISSLTLVSQTDHESLLIESAHTTDAKVASLAILVGAASLQSSSDIRFISIDENGFLDNIGVWTHYQSAPFSLSDASTLELPVDIRFLVESSETAVQPTNPYYLNGKLIPVEDYTEHLAIFITLNEDGSHEPLAHMIADATFAYYGEQTEFTLSETFRVDIAEYDIDRSALVYLDISFTLNDEMRNACSGRYIGQAEGLQQIQVK